MRPASSALIAIPRCRVVPFMDWIKSHRLGIKMPLLRERGREGGREGEGGREREREGEGEGEGERQMMHVH